MPTSAALYIGLMSGTSLDGVDGVLVRFAAAPAPALQVLAHAHIGFEAPLRDELLRLNQSGADELHRAALAANALARDSARCVAQLLERGAVAAPAVRAIGSHGQTVRHCPGAFDGVGYTLQINQPALLAELTGIDVVCDFRSRDVAAGGQGAPLVPAFHRVVFGRPRRSAAVLNLGGMANLSVLGADGTTRGFDCGPGNALLDHWCALHRGCAYDDRGAWAASGRVVEPLLQALRDEPFLHQAPPKSTGRDLFNAGWLAARLATLPAPARPEDVQATLAEFTAAVCADALAEHGAGAEALVVCGGGAYNDDLIGRLRARAPGVAVETSDRRGLPPTQVEACAFAWLARACVEREALSLGAITGARGARILGAVYPG